MGKGKVDNKMTFNRLVWLLDIIYRAGYDGITKREIFEKWQKKTELSEGKEYPERTFRNHINNIKDIFDVEIECIGHRYRIPFPDDMEIYSLTNWMVNSISVKNTIVDNTKLRRRILFEPIPAGGRLLEPILEAMKNDNTVEIEYRKFDEGKLERYSVEPYFLKLFRRRWYLVGECPQKGCIYTFSLDRIRNLSATKQSFKMPEIDEEDFFGNSFGIMWSNEPPKEVSIKVYGEQVDYIKSAPLHHSQKEISQAKDGTSLFSYNLHITYDFVQELLSHGKNIQVLQPAELKKVMRTHISAMLKYYP